MTIKDFQERSKDDLTIQVLIQTGQQFLQLLELLQINLKAKLTIAKSNLEVTPKRIWIQKTELMLQVLIDMIWMFQLRVLLKIKELKQLENILQYKMSKYIILDVMFHVSKLIYKQNRPVPKWLICLSCLKTKVYLLTMEVNSIKQMMKTRHHI